MISDSHKHQNASPPLIAKNTLLNLFGYGAPLLVAVFSIPLIVGAIGTDRFGILTLAWVVIGYLSLLDMGLGRALTKFVSEKLGEESIEEIPAIIWTALTAMVAMAVIIGLIFGFCSHWIVFDLLTTPKELQKEVRTTFLMIAAFMPIMMLSVGFRGVLEAYQRFDIVNAVRIPLGIFSFAAPLAVIAFSISLPSIIIVLLLGRIMAMLVQTYCCYRIVDHLLTGFSIKVRLFGKLLRFGGWMTITNVISPLLVYFDRFFIASFLSVTLLAYYATPNEVITKLTLISGALMSVIFPAISTSYNLDRKYSGFLLDRGLKYIFITIFPIVSLIICFAPEGLLIWLNEQFVQNSLHVTRVLTVGIFFACLGQIPYAFIQGAGRPDFTGKLHLIELPLYLILLYAAIQWFGIIGAALIWTLRFVVDSICMYLFAQKMLGAEKLRSFPKISALGLALICLFLLCIIGPLIYRVVGYIIVVAIYVLITTRILLSKDEKKFVKKMISSNLHKKVKYHA